MTLLYYFQLARSQAEKNVGEMLIFFKIGVFWLLFNSIPAMLLR